MAKSDSCSHLRLRRLDLRPFGALDELVINKSGGRKSNLTGTSALCVDLLALPLRDPGLRVRSDVTYLRLGLIFNFVP
jgi:hypothetical protein